MQWLENELREVTRKVVIRKQKNNRKKSRPEIKTVMRKHKNGRKKSRPEIKTGMKETRNDRKKTI